MRLIGLDIGFSLRRRTNAIADWDGSNLDIRKLSVAERDDTLSKLGDFDVLAIDAPIVPSGVLPETPREAEKILARGAFQRRCKPAASHVRGTGRTLREHGARAAELASRNVMRTRATTFPTVITGVPVVEAFPNALLGIALAEHFFESRPALKRGGKFDWLYACWLKAGMFPEVIEHAGLPARLASTFTDEKDHEKRAALVCLLAAGLVGSGRAKEIGDDVTGYIFIPDRSLWATWATTALPETPRRG